MPIRSSIGAVVLATMIVTTIATARAHDETKYPDWSGQWLRTGGIQWDPTKPIGRGQQAPLTPEYQAIFEASLADQALGGTGNDPRYACLPVGMPRLMSVIFPMEFIFTPKIAYSSRTTCPVGSIPTGAVGPTIPSRPSPAIRSANGSMRTQMAATTCSRSRPVT